MEGAEIAESFNEWEQIQFETAADFSIFPQLNQEGLKIPPPPPPPDAQIHSEQNSADDACNAEGEKRLLLDSNPKVGNNIGKRLKLRIQILRSWVAWVASRGCGCGGGGLWSFRSMSVVVAAAAVLLCLRVQRWRLRVREKSENPLVLVIKEKDQRISQLLLQIAKMQESLSARRTVPVIRVLD